MKFEERKILLKDGRTCVLKPNSPEYAQEMLDYLRKTSAETEYLLRYPDEVKFTLESEKEILGNLLENPYAIMMIAVVDGKVAGNGSVNGIGDKRKIQHRCSLAIALYEEFWGIKNEIRFFLYRPYMADNALRPELILDEEQTEGL